MRAGNWTVWICGEMDDYGVSRFSACHCNRLCFEILIDSIDKGRKKKKSMKGADSNRRKKRRAAVGSAAASPKLEKFATVDGRGVGVRTLCTIARGECVVSYEGERITKTEAEHREDSYEKRGDQDCYLFFFTGGVIDATDSEHISRFVNHSRVSANLQPRLKNGAIVFIAKRDIEVGEELLFDYGDRRRDIVNAFPWLAK
jgi:histone-lysine N-methyltransferase SETD8